MKAGVEKGGNVSPEHMKYWCERGGNLNGEAAVMRECIRGKRRGGESEE